MKIIIVKISIIKINLALLFFYFLLANCGTIYVPQILPEGRGISRSEGQEKVNINLIPLTMKAIIRANEDNYVRRVVDSGDLTRAAKLISVNQAINERIPKNNDLDPINLALEISSQYHK